LVIVIGLLPHHVSFLVAQGSMYVVISVRRTVVVLCIYQLTVKWDFERSHERYLVGLQTSVMLVCETSRFACMRWI
jgi:hypothetical protein